MPELADISKLCLVTKAMYILGTASGLGVTSGLLAASWPVDWLSSVSQLGQYVFDAYFIVFVDAVNFGTLCF